MYRIIVNMREGEFMLLRDFPDTTAATEFARKVGFSTYEITNDFNDDEWEVIDPSLDPDKLMSFMRRKQKPTLDNLILAAQENGAIAMQIAIMKILNSPLPSSNLADAINNADWKSELKGAGNEQ